LIKLVRPKEIDEKIKQSRLLERATAFISNKNSKRIPCKKCGFYFFPNKKEEWSGWGYCSYSHVPNKTKRKLARKKKAASLVLTPKFYETREWQALRYSIIKKYDRKCMVCFRTGVELHVDHIKPISKYPELALISSNLQVLCRDCNLGKGNKDSIDWRPNA
jgi:hypothetical protein